MQSDMDPSQTEIRRIASIREEMRFEVGVLHDRINALISSEAFLMIAYTMALAYSDAGWNTKFYFVAPLLSIIGLSLAVLSWPGVNTSVKIINEWNSLLVQALDDAPAITRFMWRPSLLDGGTRRADIDHRHGMIFARAVPLVFAAAWAILAVLVLMAPWR